MRIRINECKDKTFSKVYNRVAEKLSYKTIDEIKATLSKESTFTQKNLVDTAIQCKYNREGTIRRFACIKDNGFKKGSIVNIRRFVKDVAVIEQGTVGTISKNGYLFLVGIKGSFNPTQTKVFIKED